MKKGTVYTKENLREISVPLGGIGSGSIGLMGNGRLGDWEIANRPGKGMSNGHSFFAVKAEKNGKLVDARVLQGDCPKDIIGQYQKIDFKGFGYGPQADTLAGFPHFEDITFDGAFPVAKLSFADGKFPGKATLTAFNPFIPLDEDASSLPAAFFAVELKNDTEDELDYTVALSVRNWFEKDCENLALENGVKLVQHHFNEKSPFKGEMCVLTDGKDVQVQPCWFRGKWFDGATVFWKQFTDSAPLPGRTYETYGSNDNSTTAVKFTVPAGQSKTVRFVLAWYFPNNYNYWYPELLDDNGDIVTWKNWYATRYDGAKAVADYALRNFEELYAKTEAFGKVLWSATLPESVVEAAADTLSVLKSPTVLRLEDGSFYGWEGVHELAGSCEGSCQHVWNYTYALPYLFPRLERSMRRLDYKYNLMENGAMRFRLTLPVGRPGGWDMPCVDGQMGGVIKTYRDWKICGDDEFLKEVWPGVKKSLEFAWSDKNACRWDADKDGILEGRQHHTLDMELYGPSSWLEGFYLAALKAAAEMAQHLGEEESAEEYLELYEKGKKFLNEELFGGEYFIQKVDLTDRSILESYGGISTLNGGNILADYWNDEAGEIKYQVANGSSVDQALAQWHADLMGLGEIFDAEKLDTALESLYKYNFVPKMRDFFNPCRVFSLDGDAGTIICAYPEHITPPAISVPYCQETMNGFEYSAAGLMISRGKLAYGETMVKAVRDRFDGDKRNPYNEYECGNNYARSMASYALVNLYGGYEIDMTKGFIGFAPKAYDENGVFHAPFAVDSGWGEVTVEKSGAAKLQLLGGKLSLRSIKLPFEAKQVLIDGKAVEFAMEDGVIVFKDEATAVKEIAVK